MLASLKVTFPSRCISITVQSYFCKSLISTWFDVFFFLDSVRYFLPWRMFRGGRTGSWWHFISYRYIIYFINVALEQLIMMIFVYLNKLLGFKLFTIVYIFLFVDSEASLSENWLPGGIYRNCRLKSFSSSWWSDGQKDDLIITQLDWAPRIWKYGTIV